MAETDTSSYPKTNQTNLLEIYGGAANLRNALLAGDRAKVGLQSDKQELARRGFQWLSQGIDSLGQDPRIATPEGPALIRQFAAQGIQQGWLTPEIVDAQLANMPSDPAQLPQFVQQMGTQAQDAKTQFDLVHGTPQMINDGTQQVPVAVSPIVPMRQLGAPIQNTLSPSERSELVPTTNAEGQGVLTPKGNLLRDAGMNPMTAVPMTASTGPGNSIIASPPAGDVAAQTAVGGASGSQLAEDSARERNFQADIVPLEKARDALIKLGPTGTGPGTEQINEVKSFLSSMGIIGPQDEVKNFDEARKYLVQYASQAGSPNTNDKLAAAFAGNPNVGISNAAATDVLKTVLSVRRLQNAQVRAFAQSGEKPSSYSQWATEFNASQDPVAYGFDMLSSDERSKYIKGLDAAGKEKLRSSLQNAMSLGLVTPPGK